MCWSCTNITLNIWNLICELWTLKPMNDFILFEFSNCIIEIAKLELPTLNQWNCNTKYKTITYWYDISSDLPVLCVYSIVCSLKCRTRNFSMIIDYLMCDIWTFILYLLTTPFVLKCWSIYVRIRIHECKPSICKCCKNDQNLTHLKWK